MGNKSRSGRLRAAPRCDNSSSSSNNNNDHDHDEHHQHDNFGLPDAEDPAETAREHPNRVSHGFWLRQYSWLHAGHEGCVPVDVDAEAETPASPQAGRDAKRPRLLARWTNLIRHNFGGSTSEVSSSEPVRATTSAGAGSRSGARSAPLGRASQSPTSVRASKRARTDTGKPAATNYNWCGWQSAAPATGAGQARPAHHASSPTKTSAEAGPKWVPVRGLGWLLRSVSGSTCTLPADSQAAPGHERRRADETPNDDNNCSLASPSKTSPYRRLARAFRAQQVGAPAPADRTKKQRTGHQADGATSILANLFVSPRFRRGRAAGGAHERDAHTATDKNEIREKIWIKTDAREPGGRDHMMMRAGKLEPTRGAHVVVVSSFSENLDEDKRDARQAGSNLGQARARQVEQDNCSSELKRKKKSQTQSSLASDEFELERTAPPPESGAQVDHWAGGPDTEPLKSYANEPNGAGSTTTGDAAWGTPAAHPRPAQEEREPAADGAKISESTEIPSVVWLEPLGAAPGLGEPKGERLSAGRQAPPPPPLPPPPPPPPPPPTDASISHLTGAGSQGRHDQRQAPVPVDIKAHETDEQFGASHATTTTGASSYLQLIQPLASSTSSFGSSSICYLDSSSQLQINQSHEKVTRVAIGVSVVEHVSASDDGTRANEFGIGELGVKQQQQLDNEPDDGVDENEAGGRRPASQPVGGACQRAGRLDKLYGSGDTGTPAGPSGVTRAQNVAEAQLAGSGGGFGLKSNFKKLVKRQQSVDSYRMARDLKNKLKRQQEGRNKHQSNEAIKTAQSVGDNDGRRPTAGGRKYSMRQLEDGGEGAKVMEKLRQSNGQQQEAGASVELALKICVDPYAEPGSFTLPGSAEATGPSAAPAASGANEQQAATKQTKVGPTPPNTLSLMPSGGLFMGNAFSGCITPTYPTHHFPSPKYVSPTTFSVMEKKYSNASTISSSLGGESLANNATSNSTGGSRQQTSAGQNNGRNQNGHQHNDGTMTNQSDTESSLGGGSVTPLRGSVRPQQMGARVTLGEQAGGAPDQQHQQQLQRQRQQEALAREEADAAARRANLAEHIYDNKCGLGEDMKFLASLPELCDITFLVGETREPVCAVKSVLAARSRVFHKILFGNRMRSRFNRQAQQEEEPGLAATAEPGAAEAEAQTDRRGSSPRPAHTTRSWASAAKSSSPVSRSASPNQQQPHSQHQQAHHQWSVTSDTSGCNPSRAPGDSPAAGGRSGRVSVASNGRESGVSQSSQGSQQPLIIGPGQMAAPAKRTKKGAVRPAPGQEHHQGHAHHGASRLRSMFMNKRASDPSIKHNNQVAPSAANVANQNYLDKMMSTTMIIEEFEPDVFRQLIEYIHTGCVLLQARTLLGLLNAADYYGLEQLRRACLRFVSCCITVDTVCSLLSTAERYIQYKCTKSIVQKVLEFVDTHANEIFKLNAFGLLPEHVVRLILARDGLQADEHVKYNGVYTWCEHYCRSYELTNISDVMRNFLDLIQLYKIPTNILLSEIYPTHVVPDNIFLSALAYQADPDNFEPQQARPRRMTLPNPTIHSKDYAPPVRAGQTEDDENRRPRTGAEQDQGAARSRDRRRGSAADKTSRRDSATSVPPKERAGAHKSSSVAGSAPSPTKSKASRKGSIAQASISGVIRLSHRLSIRKRHSNMNAGEARRRGSSSACAPPVSKLVSLVQGPGGDRADPLQVGQQILDAYLADQRQRELQEEEQRRAAPGAADTTGPTAGGATGADQQQQPGAGQRQPNAKGALSSRKSFKDFKHISRRLFMRHSSSKILQQQLSSTSSGDMRADNSRSLDKPSEPAAQAGAGHERRRHLLKIKRSETVFEAATSSGARLSHQLSSNIK